MREDTTEHHSDEMDEKTAKDRKTQNRLAQREFRQRKQQYVKELEAKVQVLSQPLDAQVVRLRSALIALMEENKQLRELLAHLSGFIGKQTPVCLAEYGFKPEDFEAFMKKSERQTAFDALRMGDDMENSSSEFRQPKRKRDPSSAPRAGSSATPPAATTSATDTTLDFMNNMFPNNMDPYLNGTVGFPPDASMPPTIPGYFAPNNGIPPNFPHGFLNPTDFMEPTALLSSSTPPSSKQSHSDSPGAAAKPPAPATTTTPPTAVHSSYLNLSTACQQLHIGGSVYDACQLVDYHIRNKTLNENYTLPTSLQPTALQAQQGHPHVIDGFIFADLRDWLIGNQHEIGATMDNFVREYLVNVRIHNDDPMDASNWELSAAFIDKWRMMLPDSVVAMSQRWQ